MANNSGHCGNSLIGGSLEFYNGILNNELNFNLFNEKTHCQKHCGKFWSSLINKFEVNNRLSDLADIICLIELMWKTVPIERKKNKNKNKKSKQTQTKTN